MSHSHTSLLPNSRRKNFFFVVIFKSLDVCFVSFEVFFLSAVLH